MMESADGRQRRLKMGVGVGVGTEGEGACGSGNPAMELASGKARCGDRGRAVAWRSGPMFQRTGSCPESS